MFIKYLFILFATFFSTQSNATDEAIFNAKGEKLILQLDKTVNIKDLSVRHLISDEEQEIINIAILEQDHEVNNKKTGFHNTSMDYEDLLFYSIQHEYFMATKYLLESKIVNINKIKGYTPLISAALSQNKELFKYILDNTSDENLNEQDPKTKMTAIFFLFTHGGIRNIQLIELALLRNWNPNPQNYKGIPLLSIIASQPELSESLTYQSIILLLKNNVNLNATDSNGHNAIWFAKQNNNNKILPTLLQLGIPEN